MKFRAFLLIILFFQCVTQGLTFAATEIDLSQEGEVNITSSFSYHSGSENFPSDFTPIKESEFHHSYTSKNIWLLGRFKNESSFPVEKIIYLSSLTIGDLVFYKKVLGEWKEFEKFEIHKDRDRLGFFPKFHLSLGSNDEMEVLIKRQGLHHLDTKILLTDANLLNKLEKKTERLYTFYLGFVVALALFNLVIFVLTKDKNYLIYTVFIISIGLLILSLVGAIDGIYINKQLNKNIGSFSSISIALAFFFSYRFLRLKQKVPKAKYFFIPCVCTSVIIVLINQTYLYAEYTNIWGTIIDLNIVIAMFVLLYVGFYLSIVKRDKIAMIYTLSWLFMFGGGFVWLAVTKEFLPVNFFTKHAILFGNIIEMLLLSSALAYKYNTLQEELRVKKEVEKSHEKYKKLLRVLSHDIANSLFIISGYTKRFRRRPELFDANESWEKIEKATIHMEKILDTVKAEQAYEMNVKGLRLDSVSLDQVLKDTLEIYQSRIEAKQLEIELKSELDLNVWGHYSVLVHQVFGNIISNAVKFSHAGHKIVIEVCEDRKFATITIRDFGIGMSEEDLKAFNEGRDISSKIGTGGERGTGFGMYLIQSYVKLFKGVYKINSLLNVGTTVTVSIPKVREKDER